MAEKGIWESIGVENGNYKHLIISYVRSIIFLWLPDGGKAIPLLPATSFL